jgi:hypothetical protein
VWFPPFLPQSQSGCDDKILVIGLALESLMNMEHDCLTDFRLLWYDMGVNSETVLSDII